MFTNGDQLHDLHVLLTSIIRTLIIIDFTERNANHIIPTYCDLPVSCSCIYMFLKILFIFNPPHIVLRIFVLFYLPVKNVVY